MSAGGRWAPCALDLFEKNQMDPQTWIAAVLRSWERGRSKGALLCHAGLKCNEGERFLLAPLLAVFGGRPSVQPHFDPLQLLCFEGKPIVIARPQNQHSGRLKYRWDAPVFTTTLESDIAKLRGKKPEAGDIEMMLRRLKFFGSTWS